MNPPQPPQLSSLVSFCMGVFVGFKGVKVLIHAGYLTIIGLLMYLYFNK